MSSGYLAAATSEDEEGTELANIHARVDGDRALDSVFDAAQHGDEEEVLLRISNGTSIDDCDSKGDTVLHHAVRGNHVELVRSLLGMHPPPRLNLRNHAGAAPIHLASEDCGGGIDLELFEALLAARPDVNATNGDGDAPLHVLCREAGSAPFVRALVSRQAELGLEIDKPNLTGATPLMIAIVQSDSPSAVEVARALLTAKVAPNVNALNPSGNSILLAACKKGYARMADCLLSTAPHTNVNFQHAIDGLTALHAAASHASPDTLKVLLYRAPSLATPLVIDTALGPDGETALMIAIRRSAIRNDKDSGSADLNPEKVVQDPLERVRCLLDHRPAPSLDAVNAAGETALMIAVRATYAHAVRLLLVQQPGPSLDVRNRAGQKLRDVLAAVSAAHAESESGPPVQDPTQSKARAHTAQQLLEIRGMVKAHAAGKSVDGFLAEHFGIEIAAFLEPNLLDAARRRDRATVSYCLAHGADINAADKKLGNTALLLACDAHAENDISRPDLDDEDGDEDGDDRGDGRFSSSSFRDDGDDGLGGAAVAIVLAVPRVPALAPPPFDFEFARLVLRTPRCNANAQNRAGNSALMLAASGGAAYWPLLELLCALEPPVDLELRNRAGCTALMLAALTGNEPAVRALLAMRPPPSVHAADAAGQTAIDMAKTEAIRRLLRAAPAPPACCAIA